MEGRANRDQTSSLTGPNADLATTTTAMTVTTTMIVATVVEAAVGVLLLF